MTCPTCGAKCSSAGWKTGAGQDIFPHNFSRRRKCFTTCGLLVTFFQVWRGTLSLELSELPASSLTFVLYMLRFLQNNLMKWIQDGWAYSTVVVTCIIICYLLESKHWVLQWCYHDLYTVVLCVAVHYGIVVYTLCILPWQGQTCTSGCQHGQLSLLGTICNTGAISWKFGHCEVLGSQLSRQKLFTEGSIHPHVVWFPCSYIIQTVSKLYAWTAFSCSFQATHFLLHNSPLWCERPMWNIETAKLEHMPTFPVLGHHVHELSPIRPLIALTSGLQQYFLRQDACSGWDSGSYRYPGVFILTVRYKAFTGAESVGVPYSRHSALCNFQSAEELTVWDHMCTCPWVTLKQEYKGTLVFQQKLWTSPTIRFWLHT